MMKLLSEMTRTDWLTRHWINTTPPGSAEMMFTDAGDLPPAVSAVLLDVLHAGVGREPSMLDRGDSRGPCEQG